MPDQGASGATTAHHHGFHTVRVARVVPRTAEAVSIVLDVPPDEAESFEYRAGQFCTFRVSVAGETLLRSYSMSSAPSVDAELAVTVKRVPGGAVSNWMNDHLAPGDDVEVTRPAGVFVLAPGAGDVAAFAAGSGITPVISLVKEALATSPRRVRLLYANRDTDSTIFRSELDALASDHGDRLVIEHHLDVDHGYVDDAAVDDFLTRTAWPSAAAQAEEVFVCGPEPFMDVVETALVAAGADPHHVHIERFTPASVPDPVGPPDGTSSPDGPDAPEGTTELTITVDGRTETTTHHPGTTVLQAARQAGLTAPSSCESGSCATCMARILDGTADMRVNDALSDDEVADGWILTCQAVPTSAVLRVEYGYD